MLPPSFRPVVFQDVSKSLSCCVLCRHRPIPCKSSAATSQQAKKHVTTSVTLSCAHLYQLLHYPIVRAAGSILGRAVVHCATPPLQGGLQSASCSGCIPLCLLHATVTGSLFLVPLISQIGYCGLCNLLLLVCRTSYLPAMLRTLRALRQLF